MAHELLIKNVLNVNNLTIDVIYDKHFVVATKFNLIDHMIC